MFNSLIYNVNLYSRWAMGKGVNSEYFRIVVFPAQIHQLERYGWRMKKQHPYWEYRIRRGDPRQVYRVRHGAPRNNERRTEIRVENDQMHDQIEKHSKKYMEWFSGWLIKR